MQTPGKLGLVRRVGERVPMRTPGNAFGTAVVRAFVAAGLLALAGGGAGPRQTTVAGSTRAAAQTLE
jgi:hypothetical protein